LTDIRITNRSQIKPIIEKLAQNGEKTLVVIGPEIEDIPMYSVLKNRASDIFNMVFIPSPGFNQLRDYYLKDISVVTGATVVTATT